MSTPNGQFPDSNYLCYNCGRRSSNGRTCIHCQSEFLEELPQQQTSDSDLPLIHQFQNLFNHDFNLQTFTNTLLPMLMPQIQSDLPPVRYRRGRTSRRIKRVIDRYSLPPGLFNINGLNSQIFIFDSIDENFPPGIFRENINQLPTLTMTPSNLQLHPTCTICLENFDISSDVKQLPICHHIFHRNCLTEWFLYHNNCPMCRTNISSIQQRTNPTFNNHWLQQLLLQTFGSQQTNRSIKTINRPSISSNLIESNQQSSSSDAPQLPHFDPSSNPE